MIVKQLNSNKKDQWYHTTRLIKINLIRQPNITGHLKNASMKKNDQNQPTDKK